MKFQFFSINAMDPASGQDALNRFLSSYSIASLEKQFVSAGGNSFWSVCIGYIEGAERADPRKAKYESAPGKGLPIGSLTSQYFANYYLDRLDRLIAEQSRARAYLRYMDDMVWWCDDRCTGKEILGAVTRHAADLLKLKIKDLTRIQRSNVGMSFCGYRIRPGALRLSLRKKRRYVERKQYWEAMYAAGDVDAAQLQRAFDSVRGMVAYASTRGWMRRQEALRPALEI